MFESSVLGKWLVLIGSIIAGIGLLFWFGGKIGLGKLPGDLSFGGTRWKIYFPIATTLLLTLLLNLILWLFRKK